jgi:hypothetical protein
MSDLKKLACPVCYDDLEKAQIPGYSKELMLYGCSSCKEGGLYQMLPDGKLLQLTQFFDRVSMGDERTLAAVSTPHIASMQNFLGVIDRFDHSFMMERSSLAHALMSVMAQIENRIDSAISRLQPLEFINDDVVTSLRLLREAREMVSASKSRNRGIVQEERRG